MKINNEERFQNAPTVLSPRSTFLMHQNIRTTFNAAKLIPFYVDSDIMPGDTFKIKGTFVIRQSTPIHPTMDNCFLDVFFFFIPHRLVWTHWKEFWGENTTGSWTQTTQYTIPQISIGKTGFSETLNHDSSLAYMGIPLIQAQTADGINVNALPWRAYALTWNEWFRDENLCPPINFQKGDATANFYKHLTTTTTNWWGNYASNVTGLEGTCAPVYKYKDYFNSCQPEPQKGGAINLPLGQTAPIHFRNDATVDTNSLTTLRTYDSTGTAWNNPGAYAIGANINGNVGYLGSGLSPYHQDVYLSGYADLSNAVAATINAQRVAFAAQRILEAKARTGSRYTEIIRGIFNVTSPDARQQRPEYLGGKRIPITMNQVVQTSSTDNITPQGNTAAYSLTVDSDHLFTKSFTEHGTLLGLLCVRQEHSYSQGINRMWSRKDVLDFYTPQMAFLGEQAVLNKEIYATGTSTDDQVFGYNERWAELRYKPNLNTGSFSTQYALSLDTWHFGDDYASLPVLSDAWRRETEKYIDRTLAVQSTQADQFIMDSRLEMVATRPLPMYSIPGLLDHF